MGDLARSDLECVFPDVCSGAAAKMEVVRISKAQKVVFSYRFQPDAKSGDLFDREMGWTQFMEESIRLSS